MADVRHVAEGQTLFQIRELSESGPVSLDRLFVRPARRIGERGQEDRNRDPAGNAGRPRPDVRGKGHSRHHLELHHGRRTARADRRRRERRLHDRQAHRPGRLRGRADRRDAEAHGEDYDENRVAGAPDRPERRVRRRAPERLPVPDLGRNRRLPLLVVLLRHPAVVSVHGRIPAGQIPETAGTLPRNRGDQPDALRVDGRTVRREHRQRLLHGTQRTAAAHEHGIHGQPAEPPQDGLAPLRALPAVRLLFDQLPRPGVLYDRKRQRNDRRLERPGKNY